MRAGVLHAIGDLRVEDRPAPRPGAGDVLVAVSYNGLCGTDASEYAKASLMVPLERPHPASGHRGATVLGHEFVGTVVEAGEGAQHLIGTRVACGAGISCGECRWCAAGRTNLCARYYTLGLSTHGGLAEYAVSPARATRPVPDGCAEEDAGLAQPLAVGIHAVRRSGLRPGDRVVVLGAGAIGSFVLAAMRGHEGEIVALDIDEQRTAGALALGATAAHVIAPDAQADDLRDLVPGGADVVFETSGVVGAVARAFAMTARGGTTLLVGLNKTPQPLDLSDIVLREVDVRTTVAHVCADDLPDALDLLTATPLAPALVDRIVPLEDVVDGGLRPLVAGEVRGKVLVDCRTGRG